MFYISLAFWLLLALIVVIKLARCFRLVPNRRTFIVERLGKYHQSWGPGFHMLLPFFDRVAFQQDLKEEAIDVPPQECFTKDNVQVEVDGVLYLSVTNAVNASYGVTNYRWAAVQLAQTTTRSVIGTLELDRTFEERDAVNSRVVSVLNEVSEAWGIKLHRYEVKNIVVPGSVRSSMEQQMGAERDRRALIARSEGEKQSKVNASEATRMELINRSEGEKQKRINEAEGRAAEIQAVAEATAESIEKIGQAMSMPGGPEAVNLRLSERYLGKLGALARRDKTIVIPSDLTQLDGLLAGLGLELPDEAMASAAVAVAAAATAATPRRAAPVRKPQLPPKPSPAAATIPSMPVVDPPKQGD